MNLRQLERKDADSILRWMNDEDVIQNFKISENNKNMDSVIAFIKNSFNDKHKHFAIVDDEDRYMGTISLKNISLASHSAEFAVVLCGEYIGKGIGEQATKLLLDYASKELKLSSIYLNVLQQNERAIKMYRKLGFEFYESTHEDISGKNSILEWYKIDLGCSEKEFYQLINLEAKGNETGHLVALQMGSEIPFEFKRLFYIYGLRDEATRGNHANIESEFLFICVAGSCKIQVDSGAHKKDIVLDSPDRALYLDKQTWKTMYDFSDDAVLLVLTNTLYNPDDYIYNYDEFLEIRGVIK